MEDLLNIVYANVDNALVGAAGTVRIALAESAGPFLLLLIACMFAYYLISMAFQSRLDIPGLLYFGFRAFVIYSLVVGGAFWSDYALPFIVDFGENVGKTIFDATYTGDGGGAVGASDEFVGFIGLLTAYLDDVYEIAGKLQDNVEGSTFISWQEIVAGILYAFAVLLAVIVVAVAFIILIVCKMLLYILISISPLFLVWAFLGGTSSIVQGWLRGLINVLTAQLLTFAILGVVLAVAAEANEYLEALADGTAGSDPDDRELLLQLLFLCFVGFVGMLMLGTVPRVSAAISGGGITVGQSMIDMQRRAQNAAGGAAKAGGAAVAGAAISGAATAAQAGVDRIRTMGRGPDAASERAGAVDDAASGGQSPMDRARRNLSRRGQ